MPSQPEPSGWAELYVYVKQPAVLVQSWAHAASLDTTDWDRSPLSKLTLGT